MDVQIVRYPGEIFPVVKWACNRKRPKPEGFEEFLLDLMPHKCRAVFGYHVNVHTCESPVEDGWIRGYPHSHVWSVDWPPDTFTCLTFLAVADEGGEFALGGLERDDPYELVTPEIGQVFMFDAMRWHGIKPVIRGTRISLLCSGVPEE